MQLRVRGHEDDVLFFSLGVYDRESMIEPTPPWPSNRYEWFAYGVVNLMLEQMGWIECPTTWCR